jgi:hypothetical protein
VARSQIIQKIDFHGEISAMASLGWESLSRFGFLLDAINTFWLRSAVYLRNFGGNYDIRSSPEAETFGEHTCGPGSLRFFCRNSTGAGE